MKPDRSKLAKVSRPERYTFFRRTHAAPEAAEIALSGVPLDTHRPECSQLCDRPAGPCDCGLEKAREEEDLKRDAAEYIASNDGRQRVEQSLIALRELLTTYADGEAEELFNDLREWYWLKTPGPFKRRPPCFHPECGHGIHVHEVNPNGTRGACLEFDGADEDGCPCGSFEYTAIDNPEHEDQAESIRRGLGE